HHTFSEWMFQCQVLCIFTDLCLITLESSSNSLFVQRQTLNLQLIGWLDNHCTVTLLVKVDIRGRHKALHATWESGIVILVFMRVDDFLCYHRTARVVLKQTVSTFLQFSFQRFTLHADFF